MPTVKLSDYVFQFLARRGVRQVFVLVGGGAMHLNDSLGAAGIPGFVCNLHEQACSIAAEAFAKASGGLGVALVTTGPGGTNALTGLVGAWQDSTPCLFLSGQVKRPDLMTGTGVRQMGVQEVDIVTIVRSVTKYAVTVMDPADIRFHLEQAWHLALTGRPGPVWIDIPLDVQAAPIDPDSLRGFDPAGLPPAPDGPCLAQEVSDIIDGLNAAERPVLLGGNGIRLAGAVPDFRHLAERLQIPVLLTWPAMDFLPDTHPLLVGRPGAVAPRGANFTLQNADFLLAVGTRLDLVLTGFAPDRFARGARRVAVDIDPHELAKLRPILHQAVCTDAGAFLRELARQADRLRPRDRSLWSRRCQDWKARYPVVLPAHRQPDGRVSGYFLTEVLSDLLTGGELIVPGSSGFGIEIFLLAFRVKDGQRVFNTTALGAMGFGLPAAIGACLGGGGRRTVCVDGDGGFHMNTQELETLRRLSLPIKIFVLNNGGYASIKAMQQRYFHRFMGSEAGSGMTLPDTVKVAAAYGLATCRITGQEHLADEVAKVLAAPGPVVCEVMMKEDEPRAPMLSSTPRPDGTMVSRPLEDLWPFLDRDEFRANMIVPPLPESD